MVACTLLSKFMPLDLSFPSSGAQSSCADELEAGCCCCVLSGSFHIRAQDTNRVQTLPSALSKGAVIPSRLKDAKISADAAGISGAAGSARESCCAVLNAKSWTRNEDGPVHRCSAAAW